jgi:hypothetical protein
LFTVRDGSVTLIRVLITHIIRTIIIVPFTGIEAAGGVRRYIVLRTACLTLIITVIIMHRYAVRADTLFAETKSGYLRHRVQTTSMRTTADAEACSQQDRAYAAAAVPTAGKV